MDEATKKRIHDQIAKQSELERIRKETQDKRIMLDSKRVDLEMERSHRAEQELLRIKAANFGEMSEKDLQEMRQSNADYMSAAKKKMVFINEAFADVVPFFRKNLILIGGKTGEGKSTTVANIIFSTIKQTNPATGKPCKVLVISNEEVKEDVYNRVTCLAHGWHYANHDQFTEDQLKTFDEFMPRWTKGGRLTVIDNNSNGGNGETTSIEGIQSIFDWLIENKVYYDVVILDYYQNVKFSKKDTSLNEYEVQARLAAMLDRYKNEYPAPIVVMAQVTPPAADGRSPFEGRIKGRKVITDPSTLIMEMVAERELLRTKWIVHKSRFTESVGKIFHTGYERGKFVKYTTDFETKVNLMNERREWAKNTGTGDVFKEREDE